MRLAPFFLRPLPPSLPAAALHKRLLSHARSQALFLRADGEHMVTALWLPGMSHTRESSIMDLAGAYFMRAYSRANAWSYWGLFGLSRLTSLTPFSSGLSEGRSGACSLGSADLPKAPALADSPSA